MHALLRYIYAGVMDKMEAGQLCKLLCLAKELVLEDLVYRCEVHLGRLVGRESAAELYELGARHNQATPTESLCVQYHNPLPSHFHTYGRVQFRGVGKPDPNFETLVSCCVDHLGRMVDENLDDAHRYAEVVYDTRCRACLPLLLKGDFEAVIQTSNTTQAPCVCVCVWVGPTSHGA